MQKRGSVARIYEQRVCHAWPYDIYVTTSTAAGQHQLLDACCAAADVPERCSREKSYALTASCAETRNFHRTNSSCCIRIAFV